MSLLKLVLSKHSPKVVYIPRGELSTASISNRIIKKHIYLFFLRIIIKLIAVKWVATSKSEANFIYKRFGKADVSICPNLMDLDNILII